MSDTGWRQIPHNVECPVCGHRGTFCTVAPNGDAIQCRRVESKHPVKHKDGTIGWMHPIPEGQRPRAASLCARPAPPKRRLSHAEWSLLAKQHRTSLNPIRLRRFADSLGVSVASLEAYGVGFDRETGCFSWPMYDGGRRIVGIRIRSEDGRVKACVKGRANQNGLFVPQDYEVKPVAPECRTSDAFPLLLLLPEGPTDAAAAYDLGIAAVGRPNSASGALFVRDLLAAAPVKQEVVVVGENDGPVWPKVPDAVPLFPGVSGALSCCRQILDACGVLRLVMPPRPLKDFRDWKNAGATAADVALAAANAKQANAAYLDFLDGALEARKRRAVSLFGRMCERLAALANDDQVRMAERLRGWMRRRGYPVDVQRRVAA